MNAGPFPLRAWSTRPAHGREARQDVVAVDAHARDAESRRAPRDRELRLDRDGLGDRPLVVGAHEDDGSAEGRREHERLVHIALARGAVAEVGGGDLVGAVALNAHRIADGVQGLRADDDLRRRGVDVVRVVGRVLLAPPCDDEVGGLGAAHMLDADLAVAREGEVVVAERAGRSDLHALLPLARRPQSELPLTLEGDAFGVDPSHEHHVAIELAESGGIDIGHPAVELRIGDAFAVFIHQTRDIVDVGREVCLRCEGVHRRHPFVSRSALVR